MSYDSGRNRRFSLSVGTLIWLAGIWVAGAGSVGGSPANAETADATDEIVDQWLAIADTVLAKHVDPPTRQELLKTTIQAVCKLAKQDAPVGLATKISLLGSDDEVRTFLRSTLAMLSENHQIATAALHQEVIRGLLVMVGAPGVIPLEQFHVQQQLRDNRYVGIGIQLSATNGYPTMNKAFPRGPAWNAGGRDGDQMVSIDGIDARNMPLPRVVELLRGQEGKPTTVVVHRSSSDTTHTLNMVRGVVPFDTVLGTQRDEDQNWQYKTKADSRIAYLKIESFRGSTPAELRRIAGQLHADDCLAVVLDLRRTQSGELRYAVMVADLLLGEGPIGQVLDARGRQQFDSSADQLFAGWPMAVLVDGSTSSQAEWIAAALQDGSRGTLVGSRTAGQGAIIELVELPGGIGGVRMNTGVLFRRAGKPMATRQSRRDVAAQVQMLRGPNGALGPNRATGMYPWARGLKPDQESKNHLADAVKMIQEVLGSEATAGEAPSGGAD